MKGPSVRVILVPVGKRPLRGIVWVASGPVTTCGNRSVIEW